MGKILLFYKYVDLQYPKQIQKWLQKLCEELCLKGRIIIGHEGINGTVGGAVDKIELFLNEMKSNEFFNDIDFKESDGDENYFPKLRIVIRNEIVTFGIDPQKVSAKNTGKHLKAEEVHNLLNNKPKDFIIFDARNDYESNVGYFTEAVKPQIKYFRDLPQYIDNNIDMFKDKEVLMYCTGGIRCERATAYLKEKNVAKEVYQIEGGIHRYIEAFPEGHFRGKNYVFDNRVTIAANNDVVGNCFVCKTSNDDYTNCLNSKCNKHFICCSNCLIELQNTCSKECFSLISQNKVKLRPMFKKAELTLK